MDSEIRQAAGVALKNAFTSKDPQTQQEYNRRWMDLEESTRNGLKSQLLHSLGSKNARAGTAAAQAVAAIATTELPHGLWRDLIESLMRNIAPERDEESKRCSLETIGFICEEIDPTVLESHADQIMTAVITGLRPEEKPGVRVAAANALLNSLEFARLIFDRQTERDYIMNMVCSATQANVDAIVLPIFECLSRIMQLYYPYMEPYMKQAVAQLTIQSILSTNENVVLQAIEFWSTVCDIERDLVEAETSEFPCMYFARDALPHLLPALLSLLPSHGSASDDDQDDEWNPSMAASTCVGLLSECVKDCIVDSGIVMTFVEHNITSADWRMREAAVMAYGSVMDGPSSDKIIPYVNVGLPFLLNLMTDSSVAVRDTTAWAIGRVIDFFSDLVPVGLVPHIASALTVGLGDAPRVAVNCCWSLMSLFVHFGDESNDLDSSIVSQAFPQVLNALFSATKRSDVDEANMRSAAYQSLAHVVLCAPQDCLMAVEKLQAVMLVEMGEAQSMADQIVNIDDRMRYSEIQSHLCTVLQNCVKKVGKPSLSIADQIMTLVLTIFHNAAKGRGSATELEDALLLVGTLVGEMEVDFLRFIDPLMPFLCAALANRAEAHLCMVSIGVVGDLARALGQSLLPYCNDLMMLLLQTLQDENVIRDVKPHAISAIGDISLGVGGVFVTFLPATLQLFGQAAQLAVQDEEDYDEIDWVCELREALLEAYTSIVQGLKDDQKALVALSAYLDQIVAFISVISLDTNRSEAMVRAAIGLVGDLVCAFPAPMRPALKSDWMGRFLAQPMDHGVQLSDSTISIVKWTQNVLLFLSSDGPNHISHRLSHKSFRF